MSASSSASPRLRPVIAFARIALVLASSWALRREFAGIGLADLLRCIVSQGWLHVAAALAGTVGRLGAHGSSESAAAGRTTSGERVAHVR